MLPVLSSASPLGVPVTAIRLATRGRSSPAGGDASPPSRVEPIVPGAGPGSLRGPKRLLVLEALRRSGPHVTAEEVAERVWRRHPQVARSTVYRALDAMCRMGMLQAVRLDGAALCYEIADAPHPHAVCRVCRRVTHLAPAAVSAALEAVTAVHRFTAAHDEVTVVGVCAACALQEPRTPPAPV